MDFQVLFMRTVTADYHFRFPSRIGEAVGNRTSICGTVLLLAENEVGLIVRACVEGGKFSKDLKRKQIRLQQASPIMSYRVGLVSR
jgi:hypothetical protein